MSLYRLPQVDAEHENSQAATLSRTTDCEQNANTIRILPVINANAIRIDNRVNVGEVHDRVIDNQIREDMREQEENYERHETDFVEIESAPENDNQLE